MATFPTSVPESERIYFDKVVCNLPFEVLPTLFDTNANVYNQAKSDEEKPRFDSDKEMLPQTEWAFLFLKGIHTVKEDTKTFEVKRKRRKYINQKVLK